uniref:Uncharacterized protein n=1 Tax=Angiostrongylus cantonensis TaxID=6313 RepID=A0A0K0DGX2_ANGCA
MCCVREIARGAFSTGSSRIQETNGRRKFPEWFGWIPEYSTRRKIIFTLIACVV